MTYYGLHTTKGEQRHKLIAGEDFKLIEIAPIDMHGKSPNKPIVWEEGSEKFYEHDISGFLSTLKMIDDGTFPANDVTQTPYFKQWAYKGDEVITRLRNLPDLYKNIKENGIQQPVDVEATGERLDGSFRSKIALHLGIPKLQARLRRFKWQDVDEEFLKNKLQARWLSSGKDYYEFDFGNGWKNIPEGGPVYRENAEERWKALSYLLEGDVLDLGCNEGYMSLQAALAGHKVKGYDLDWIHIANLNKLIFEWVNKKNLDVEFETKDILEVEPWGDTVLMLNVIYHLPREKQVDFLKKFKGKKIIFQCNMRKEAERETYYGSHPDDLEKIINAAGMKNIGALSWRDKPIIVAR